MKLNRPTLALALLSAALIAPAQTALHPEIDAFRSGDKAYVIAPPRPVAAFDYVVDIQKAYDGSGWMLVQHRPRRAQDAAAHITEADFMRPTETSLYHPGRNMVRPLPAAIPPGKYFLNSGVGDVVILAVTPRDADPGQEPRMYAMDVPTGRTLELQGEREVWVVDGNWFLTRREGRLALLNWNGDRQPIPLDQTPVLIQPMGEAGKFAVGARGNDRNINWHILDVNAGRIEPANSESVSKAFERVGGPPGILFAAERDRPDSQAAWFANSDAEELLDFESPTLVYGLPDGRLPHELDSRGLIAGDLKPMRFGTPAGYVPGVGRSLGAAWYVRDRMMFVRAVEEMSLADYAKYIARFAQKRAMMDAKQAGVGLLIFSADHEDRLPENAGWRDAVRPYVKNESILSRLTYLGNGERLTDVQDLQSVMGFIDTPYGRANISYDSSVRWVPKVTP